MDENRKEFYDKTGIDIDDRIKNVSGIPNFNSLVEYIKELENKIKNLGERSEPPTRCCAVLPNDEEIEQVAHDEAGGHDWDDLSQRKEFVKTFIEGAKWLRSQIK